LRIEENRLERQKERDLLGNPSRYDTVNEEFLDAQWMAQQWIYGSV
jgi:hypothetical protein